MAFNIKDCCQRTIEQPSQSRGLSSRGNASNVQLTAAVEVNPQPPLVTKTTTLTTPVTLQSVTFEMDDIYV